MTNSPQSLRQEFQDELQHTDSAPALLELEKKFLGRSGKINDLFEIMKTLPVEEKKTFGQTINVLKKELEAALAQKKSSLGRESREALDVTLSMKSEYTGNIHPVSLVNQEIEDIFVSMGFEVWDGPEVDTEYYNFETLNVPKHHPARDMQDTFYLAQPGYVLRTQTSNMQNRVMRSKKPPIRAIVPGKVFRNEATDARHELAFHQVEGILVDKNTSLAHMRYVIDAFLKKLFKRDVVTRLRPGYFPFVEPGLELDFSCLVCDAKGCRVCKHTGWLEFMGCGMIHPYVLKEAGIDPDEYSGFAFGFGLTRLVMMLYKIEDVRLFHSGDIRFLEQFR